jgi:LPXTG-motif cell wall-anchored protein
MSALEGIDGLIASAEVELSAATDVLDNVGATYTAHSVAQLQAAVDRLADAIGNRVEAELNAASSASATARNSLVGASSFNSIYDLGVGYNEADFSAASWVPLAAWLVAAQPIHDAVSDPTVAVSQATLNASANAGWSLMVGLVQTRDVANLRRVLNTYTGQLLTGQSAARLAAALDTADDLLLRATDSSDVITYAEVYVAIDALHDAYNGFVYTNDAVLRLNNYAEWFHASDFTASSATALTSALTTLNSLAYGDATTTVTAAQLADAVAAVDSAGAGLVSIEWLRNTLGSIDLPEFEAAFSASSFGPFAAAITAARAFLARAADPLVTITGAEVDSVTDSLFDTAMALVYVADLNDAVASNAGLVQSQYTAASWAVFATALADAQAIAARASDGATATPVGQDEVHDAVQALLNAVAALVAAPPLVEGPKTDTSAKMTAALPRTGGSDPLAPAGGALALMLAGAGLMAVRRRGQVTDS